MTHTVSSYAKFSALLAMIVTDEDNEQEIYTELLPILSEALKSGPKTLKVFVICTIVGANISSKFNLYKFLD